MLDLVLVLIVVLCAVWGYLRGGLVSVLALGALIVAYLASAPLGPVAAGVLAPHLPAGAAYLVGRLVAGLCVYIPLAIVAGVVDRKIGRTREGKVHRWNRALGTVCGLASGLVWFFMVVFVADVAIKVFPEARGRVAGSAKRSLFRRWLSPLNPADRFLVTDVLRLLRTAQQDPQVMQRLMEREEVRRLFDNLKFKRLVEDEQLARALRSGRVDAVLANRNLQNLLADKELQSLVLSEMRTALQEVLKESAPAGEPDR